MFFDSIHPPQSLLLGYLLTAHRTGVPWEKFMRSERVIFLSSLKNWHPGSVNYCLNKGIHLWNCWGNWLQYRLISSSTNYLTSVLSCGLFMLHYMILHIYSMWIGISLELCSMQPAKPSVAALSDMCGVWLCDFAFTGIRNQPREGSCPDYNSSNGGLLKFV